MNTALSSAVQWRHAQSQAWLAIPLTLALIVGLWVADLRLIYESPLLLTILSFLFFTVVLFIIVWLIGRSCLTRCEPGLLLLGCGALIWGLATAVASVVSFRDVNLTPTIANTSGWLSALCHLTGVSLSLRPRAALHPARRWVAAAYSLAVSCVALVAVSAVAGWIPTLFVQGQGGTPARYVVLSSTIAMFTVTAALLISGGRDPLSPFAYFYALALGLIATGLIGTMIQSSVFSALFWVSLGTQFLGGVYMLVAAIAAVREPSGGKISLSPLETAWRKNEFLAGFRQQSPLKFVVRYAAAVVAVAAAEGLRRAITAWIGPGLLPYFTFFPALMIVALLAGFGPGLLATALTIYTMHVWPLLVANQFALASLSPVDRVACVLFAGMGLLISGVAGLYRRNCYKAAAYDREAAVRESEARLAAFAEATFEGIVESEGGRIVDCNEQFARMTGYSLAELKGMEIAKLVAPEDRDRVMASILHGEHTLMENAVLRKDGARIIAEVHPQPMSPGSARRHAAIRDITERKRAEQALQAADERLRQHADKLEDTVRERTAKLQETVHELEQYAYSISHDMRAPLRAMIQYSEFLLEEYGAKLAPTGKMYLERISAAAARLDRLIHDVLSYHQVARAEMVLEPVNLDALARDIIQQYPMIQASQARIEIVGPLAPVCANLAAVTQCLSNLLGNAVKFVAPGVKPQVRIWTETRESFVRVCIEDKGIGLEPGHLDRIWGIFQQAHPSKAHEGTGIGLSIVKKAVERMGGRVGVESIPGQGSRFWFELNAV